MYSKFKKDIYNERMLQVRQIQMLTHITSTTVYPAQPGWGSSTTHRNINPMVWYSSFNIPLHILYRSFQGTVLQVTQPNQQHHSTEGQQLVNRIKVQSHQAQLTKR